MKLVINGRFLTQSVTGVQRVAIEFCEALDRMLAAGEYPGWQVEVLVPKRASLVTVPRFGSIRLRRAGVLSGHAWEQIELPVFAKDSVLLCLGNTAPLANLFLRATRTHVMVHDLSYRYFPEAYSRPFRLVYGAIIPWVLRRAAGVYTVSESERRAILDEYPSLIDASRLVAAQNGTMACADGESPARSARRDECLYVGSLTKRKNAPGLIEAAIRLVRERDVSFTFVGANSPSFEGVDLALPDDVAERITFAGQVNDAEVLRDYYRRALVFVFPSFYEASPLPPIEAMQNGCPVVASDIPSLRERCGQAAVFCDPDDTDTVVRSVESLIDDPRTWEAMADAGQRHAERFTWESQVRTVLDRVEGAAA